MIALLPISVCYIRGHLFSERYSGSFVQSSESWSTIVMFFIEKVPSPISLASFRGISLLDMLQKWCTSCLVILARLTPPPRSWAGACIFGYEEELSVDMLAGGLQQS
eukprot:602983-Pyramimonas_sp.AAC.1